MKRAWHPDELAQCWTLSPDELELLGNKTGVTRLRFAVLLKAFQFDGRFPDRRGEVAGSVVAHLASQIGVPAEAYFDGEWSERTQRHQRAQIRKHFCAAHSVAELYSVMTRLPVRPRITPEQGLLFVENLRDNLSVITLSTAKQFEATAEAARRGLGGGKVYDLLTLKCAMKASAERVYALNLTEFTRLAPPELKERLGTVSVKS